MSTAYQDLVDMITPRDTTVPGLKYYPDLEPHVSNDQDHPPSVATQGWISPHEVSDANLAVVRDVVAAMSNASQLHSIVEIGVNRNGERSMSRVLMDERPEFCCYLGIDIEDKSYLDDPERLIHTIQCSSAEQDRVRDKLREIGVGVIDLLFIDGWHSVNQCVNDWQYTDRLSDHGVVILHDTNTHPGCVALFEAIDETMYDKQRYCTEGDFGIAVMRKRANGHS